jgi:hypothetical protein
MPFLAGILSGFRQASDEAATRKIAEDQANREREGKIFEALVNSTDPEIQQLAVTGMLDSASPRGARTGMRRWLGEVQTSPTLAMIQRVMRTPPQAPSGASAAQGEMGATEPGAPAINTGAVQPPVRRVFDPEEAARQQTAGQISGRVGAFSRVYATAPDAGTRAMIRGMAGAPERATASQPVMLHLADGSSVAGSYNPYADEGTNPYTDTTGRPVSGVVRVEKIGTGAMGPRQSSTMTRDELIGQLHAEGRDDEIPTLGTGTHWRVTKNLTDQTIMGYQPAMPPTQFSSQAPPTPSGERVTFRGGQYAIDPNAPPAAIPDTGDSPEVLQAIGDLAAVKAEVPQMFGIPPDILQLDAAAKKRGYRDWADLNAKAQRGGSRAPSTTPPVRPGAAAAPAPEPSFQIDPNRLLQRMQQNRQAAGAR